VVTALHTGLRAEELCGLRPADVTVGARSGVVRVYGKRNKYREVPLNSTVRDTLRTYLAALPMDTPCLFPSRKGDETAGGEAGEDTTRMAVPITPRALGYLVARYARLAKAPDLSPHDLRHHFSYRMAKAVPLHRLAQLMGHDSLDTTRIYVASTRAVMRPHHDDLRGAQALQRPLDDFQGSDAAVEGVEELALFARAQPADHARLNRRDHLVTRAHQVQAVRRQVGPQDARVVAAPPLDQTSRLQVGHDLVERLRGHEAAPRHLRARKPRSRLQGAQSRVLRGRQPAPPQRLVHRRPQRLLRPLEHVPHPLLQRLLSRHSLSPVPNHQEPDNIEDQSPDEY